MKIVKRFHAVLLTEEGALIIRVTPEVLERYASRQVVVSTLVGEGRWKAFLYCFDCVFEDTDELVPGTHWIPALDPEDLSLHSEWHSALRSGALTPERFGEVKSGE